MKKLIFSQFKSFLTIFAFVFCCATVAFSQGCPPPPDPKVEGDCLDVETNTATISPLSEEFPDCKLQVTYKVQQCPNGLVTTLRIYDMEIDDFTSPGCDELIAKLTDESVSGQEFLRRFNVSIGRQLQDNEAKTYILDSGNPALYGCGNLSANILVNADYYQAGCVSNVKFFIGGKKFIRQLPCEATFCCGFRRTYCFDNKTKKLTFEEVQLPIKSPICGGKLPAIPSKILKFADKITQGPCIGLCGALDAKAGIVQQFKASIGNKDIQMKVYPNPSSDYINIFFDNELGGRFEIFTLEGKLLQSVKTETGSSYFDVSSFVAGTYVVRFTSLNGEVISEKISIH